MTDDDADIIAKEHGYCFNTENIMMNYDTRVDPWDDSTVVYLIERINGHYDPLVDGTMYLRKQAAVKHILKWQKK